MAVMVPLHAMKQAAMARAIAVRRFMFVSLMMFLAVPLPRPRGRGSPQANQDLSGVQACT
jgi:uncharacterized membrane protein